MIIHTQHTGWHENNFTTIIIYGPGGAQFVQSGNACLPIAAALALPSVLGARLGSQLARRLSPDLHSLIFNGGSV